jgi:hypothetical protein
MDFTYFDIFQTLHCLRSSGSQRTGSQLELVFRASRVVQWSKALHCNASCATGEPGLSPGSVAAGRNRETHGAVHNWPSVVQVRGGFDRQGYPVLSLTTDSCGGPGTMHTDTVARCTVFPPTHWCGWLLG